MTVLQALLLGSLQGIAEMLPISSSAHLVLAPWFFHFSDPGLAFDVALHLGTLLALLIFFWKEWLSIFLNFITLLKTRRVETFEQKLAGFLILASIPGAIFGFLFESKADTIFRSPLLIAIMLVAMGLVMVWVDQEDREKRKMTDMKSLDSLTIGLAQAVAIIPGVSRSGVTMTTGLFRGFKREDAARFSFLMSAPIIAGAGLLKVKDLTAAELASLPFWVAFGAAVVSSILAISFLLKYVRNHKFTVFAYYRFVLAVIIVITLFMRG